MTVEEMNAKYGAPPTASGGGTLANRWQKETSPSLGSSIAETAKGGFQNLKSGFSDVFSPPQIDSGAVKEAARGGGLGAGALELGAQALQGGEHAVAGVGKIVGGAAQIATSPVLGPATAVGSAIGKKIGNAVPADVAMRFEDALRAHPEIGKNATEIMNLLNLAVPETAEKISPAISSGIEKGKSMITPEDTLAAKTAQIESKKAATAAKVKSIAQEWEKPTIPAKTTNPASFNKARDVLAKEPETPQFLAEQGLHPADMVENGRFATEDTATALRDTAAKMSHDTIRPSLQMADYSTPRTPVPDLVKLAIQKVTEDKSLTEGERTNVIRNINKEGIALQKKYPNGMKLEDMHDNKITYASKGGYRPDKTALDNNLATANRHFGSAMQEMVEKKAPEDVPVAEFNKYLGKYYKAADYLDALDTKKAPVSLGRSFSRAALKFGGAALAEHFGGGVVSAFAGYSIGKAIEHALENMPNPVRAEFLRNLEKTNPEAFTKVQEYLKAQTSGNTGIPRLPEPTSIQLPPPSEETQMTGRARELFPKSEGGGPETPSAQKADTSVPFDGETLYHGGRDIGDNGTLTFGNYGRVGSGQDSGAIFVTPSKKYASGYVKQDGGALYEANINLNKENVFDATNPKHLQALEKQVGPEGVRMVKDTIQHGAADWATLSQFTQELQDAGFTGAKFLERPAETITPLHDGSFDLKGPPVYSYGMFHEVPVTKHGLSSPSIPKEVKGKPKK